MIAPTNHSAAMIALNADVVGYSRLMADDFEATAATMREYWSLVETTVAGGGGTLANFVGDNFMAVFEDAKDAVQTSIAITRAIEDHNKSIPPSRTVRFRMGLDQGDVTLSEGHYQGEALNIAARIQAMAREGGVSVSGRVYRALDEPALRFRPIGQRRLKNIPEPVEVYELVDLPSDEAVVDRPGPLSLEIPTVAVLPIHTEMVDETVKSLAEIVRADLIHRLAAVPELNVIDEKTSTSTSSPDASARYMLETGVHQIGDSVRVFATLFDVTTMNVVKSHKWVASPEEILSRSDELADEVARSLEIELVVGAPAGLYAELNDPEAIQNVYLGWYHLRSDTREGWTEALNLFGRVAQSHPDQPYGYVLTAFALWIGASNDWVADAPATLVQAREQAGIGMEIGDPTGMAMAVDAAVLMSMGRTEEALVAMDRLEIVRPTCDVTYGLEGSVRRYLGQWEEAVDLLDVAMRLTGINKPWYPTVKACSLFIGNRLEQALSVAETVLEHQPNNLEALLVLAGTQVELGMDRRARATAQLIRDRFPAVDVAAWLERNPYQDTEIIDRWKTDLSSVGLIGAR
jgi:class 3 adenylate cyclase/tetratricopeptide (TPR) repeat protein